MLKENLPTVGDHNVVAAKQVALVVTRNCHPQLVLGTAAELEQLRQQSFQDGSPIRHVQIYQRTA